MRALLDVNVLVALFDADHSLHAPALRWLDENGAAGWASREAAAHVRHEFWPDDLGLLDPAIADVTRVHGPKQLTDVYLLALAVAHGGRLVTFDRSIPIAAVAGAQRKHLVSI